MSTENDSDDFQQTESFAIVTKELENITDRIIKIENFMEERNPDNAVIGEQLKFEFSKIERKFVNQYETKIAEYNDLLEQFASKLNSILNENQTLEKTMSVFSSAISEERKVQESIFKYAQNVQLEHAKAAELIANIPRKTNELFESLQKRQNFYIQDLPNVLRDHMTHRIDNDITLFCFS